jgi:hypothetical protein
MSGASRGTVNLFLNVVPACGLLPDEYKQGSGGAGGCGSGLPFLFIDSRLFRAHRS